MQLQALIPFLPLLTSLAAGQTTTEAYNLYRQVCPQKNGVEEQIQHGEYVTYHCDQRPDSTMRTVVSVTTPRDCSITCTERSDCKSSSDTSAVQHESNVVHMTYRKDKRGDDLFPDECTKENAQIRELTSQVADLHHQLDLSKKDCQGGCFQCPDQNSRLFNDRGHEYKIYCNKLDDWGAANLDYKVKTPKECIEACTELKDCTRAIWPSALASNAKGECWLRKYTAQAGCIPKTDSTVYSSAHLQGAC
ncbi:hypothetical protein BBP40_011025 [Aspergillus hancockii]|nr:hypothetical protein BBP40_011025 [Aspergillus hancockii]